MKKDVKKQQKEILEAYLENLKGRRLIDACDYLDAIEEAKQLKSMCFREIMNGNQDIMRFFTDYTKLIIELKNNLPEEQVSEEEKTTIEDAFRVLNLTLKLDNTGNPTQQQK